VRRRVAPTVARRRVHAVQVDRRRAVVRPVDLARRQRHPTHGGATDAHRNAEPATAHPGHQGRRVDGPRHVGAGHPAPMAAPRHPAAVVEGREAPGRVVDPGPAPGRHRGPVAVAVRGPVVTHVLRQPDGAELGVLFPAAVTVQVFGAGHFGRDVGAGRKPLLAAVLGGHPGREAVVRQGRPGLLQFAEAAALATFQLQPLAFADELPLGAAHAQAAAPTAGPGGVVQAVEPVKAGALGQQVRLVGDELDLVGDIARAHAQRQAAAVKLEDHALVVQAQHFQLGFIGQAQHGGADAHLGAAVGGGAEAVALRQRPIALGCGPLPGFIVPPHDVAVEVGHAADAPGRVVLGPGQIARQDHEQQGHTGHRPGGQAARPGVASRRDEGVHVMFHVGSTGRGGQAMTSVA